MTSLTPSSSGRLGGTLEVCRIDVCSRFLFDEADWPAESLAKVFRQPADVFKKLDTLCFTYRCQEGNFCYSIAKNWRGELRRSIDFWDEEGEISHYLKKCGEEVMPRRDSLQKLVVQVSDVEKLGTQIADLERRMKRTVEEEGGVGGRNDNDSDDDNDDDDDGLHHGETETSQNAKVDLDEECLVDKSLTESDSDNSGAGRISPEGAAVCDFLRSAGCGLGSADVRHSDSIPRESREDNFECEVVASSSGIDGGKPGPSGGNISSRSSSSAGWHWRGDSIHAFKEKTRSIADEPLSTTDDEGDWDEMMEADLQQEWAEQGVDVEAEWDNDAAGGEEVDQVEEEESEDDVDAAEEVESLDDDEGVDEVDHAP